MYQVPLVLSWAAPERRSKQTDPEEPRKAGSQRSLQWQGLCLSMGLSEGVEAKSEMQGTEGLTFQKLVAKGVERQGSQ